MRLSPPATALALLLGGLAAAWCLAAAPRADAAVPRSFWGVSPQVQPSDAEIARMGRGKVGTLRIQVSWAATEPEEPGVLGPEYKWEQLDAVVGSAARRGIEVLPFLYSTPRWVANELDSSSCVDDCYFEPPRSAAALEAWARFAGDLADRYGPQGRFWMLNPGIPKQPIRVWQIWNEMNSPTFFRPAPDVAHYATLLRRAAQAIRSADPGARILLGGMFGTPLSGTGAGITAWDYMRQLYAVPGAAGSFDAAAPHPYSAQIKGMKKQLRRFRKAMKGAGDADTPLWVTEIGWASGGVPNPLNRGPKGQAKRLRQSFEYLRSKRKRLKIQNVTWYAWRDLVAPGAPACSWCPYAGLFESASLTPKPAWKAYTKFTGGS